MQDSNKRTVALSLGALGIVYGDLGTSPLYALHQVLTKVDNTPDHIYGVLSLVLWALVLVISTGYVTVFLRADNAGEGGILALLYLLKRKSKKFPRALFLMGVIGAGLLLGDGMITPAISVISAIEGLKIVSPDFSYLIMPASFVILLVLFLCQRFGTTVISFFFGPILLSWFFIIAILGIRAIVENPMVLKAANPYYALMFLYEGGWHAYFLLGGVFLVITGAEAMYADLGHFGKKPIRIGWFAVVLPALLLNYFGQGANLLSHPEAISNVFYSLAPSWFFYPLIVIATLATIIASQAVISASFSLTRQAILLDICPRLAIIHTSKEETGQVYVPMVNLFLAVGTLLLVVVFQSSNALAGAYGMAVNLVMLIVALLVLCVARQLWKWSYIKIGLIFFPLIFIDFMFLGANIPKIYDGAWIPLAFAAAISILMITWQKGMELIHSYFYKNKMPLSEVIKQLDRSKLNCIEDLTMIFVTDPYDNSGGSFFNYVKLNHLLPKATLVVKVIVEDFPYITEKNRYKLESLTEGYYHLSLHYGFMQTIHVPRTLDAGVKNNIFPFSLDVSKSTFLVEIIHISRGKKNYPKLLNWQKRLFSFLLRNSALDIEFFHLPRNQTISIGRYL
ncbi:potassium transporter Kup [Legionella maioricensis]|uniref:Probable potassium transport system protein Kup n=1 Tax=Legionella maioricensis TaxID=2896528 RepID=A0A9X2I946_9GAMM|nr:KUP/HAK/KT family potassium transporter [Legionella maioricensis]MCL9683134.1 KUP/HAK/KT family potassium transporter [Legionella maioricensis]MCL9688033.1 KUP/HAK/KT family potassium transporter [Legionella maioricensis]